MHYNSGQRSRTRPLAWSFPTPHIESSDTPPSDTKDNDAASPLFVPISTLADAQPYQAPPEENIVRHSAQGTLMPPIARRRLFPRGQRRFRDRLQSLEERLQLDVNGLQQEIRDLYVRQTLVANVQAQNQLVQSTNSTLQRVVDYFKVFAHGYLPSRPSAWLQQQDQFIDTALDPKLDYGPATTMHTELGLTIFRDQWHRYTQWHETIAFELESLHAQESEGSQLVIAHGATIVKINATTIEALFPTVLKDPELVQRLLGMTVRYPNRISFHVAPNGMITKISADLDFLTGLQQALGSLKVVAQVLGAARITEEQSYIGDDDYLQSQTMQRN